MHHQGYIHNAGLNALFRLAQNLFCVCVHVGVQTSF